MPVLLLLPFVAILYLYLDRLAIRAVERQLKRKPELPALLRLVAKKSVLDLMRDLTLVSLTVFSVAILVAFLTGLVIRISPQNAHQALGYLGPIAGTIREIKGWTWLGTAVLAAATALCAWIRYARAEKTLTARLAELYRDEISRLNEQRKRGEWEHLPPNEAMQELLRHLDMRGSSLTSEERDRLISDITRLDYERRMQFDWDELWNPKKAMESKPSGGPPRIVYALSGKIPLKTFKTGQRWLSLAAIGCWVFAAIGIGANAAVLPTVHQRFVTAWDIVVAQNGEPVGEENADDTPSPSLAGDASNPPVTPPDLDRVNRLARAFERAATESRSFWDNTRAAPEYRQREVREFILRSAEEVRNDTRPVAEAVHSTGPDLPAVQEQVGIAELAARERGPQTELGRIFRDHILSQTRNPERWTNWRGRMAGASEFLQYTGLDDSGEAVLGEVWGRALKQAEPSGYLAKELLKKVSKSVLETAYRQKVSAVEQALDGRISFEQAFARVREAAWRTPAMAWSSAIEMREWTSSLDGEQDTAEHLRDRPPYMRARSAAASADAESQRVAEDYAKTLSRWYGHDMYRAVGEDLVVYDDWLMPHADTAPPTLRTAFLERSVSPLEAAEIRASFSTARAFEKLRGFSRVGGIMIGRDPQATVSIVGFGWETNVSGTRLRLTKKDGSVISSRVFDPQLVRAALIYAADGRPVAVTIMNATHIGRRRILLHPALEQTAVGRDLIAADEWIFKKKDRSQIDAALHRTEQDAVLYEIAWLHRLIPYAKDAAPLWEEAKHAETQDARLAAALSRSADWSKKDRSPLAFSQKGFDTELVTWMQHCASEAIAGFGSCIETKARAEFEPLAGDKREAKWKQWTTAPPRAQSMSHIREQPFRLDTRLQFLAQRDREAPDEFEYLIQTTFGNGESFVDDNPWSDTLLRHEAAAAVAEQMQDPENQRIMRVLIDFRDVQRLFRAALTGRLGDGFPLWALSELMSALPPAEMVRMGEWEAPGHEPDSAEWEESALSGQITTLLKAARDGQYLDARLRDQLSKCQVALQRDAGTASTLAPCDLRAFESRSAAVDGSAIEGQARDVVRSAIRLVYVRQLRAALGATLRN